METKCIMPEQPYCPCCPHGYVKYDEDYDGYEQPTECEWICKLEYLEEKENE